nr:hypothetical protein [Tanacetum cinerariifolium]
YNEETLCVGFARLGSEDQMVVAGIVIAPGAPVIIGHRRLPCCGCGIGWFLEKPGLVACTIRAILVLIAVCLVNSKKRLVDSSKKKQPSKRNKDEESKA